MIPRLDAIGFEFSEKGLKDLKLNSIKSIQKKDKRLSPVLKQLKDYFLGKRVQFRIQLDLSNLSPFTRKVLLATKRIPYGKTVTYQELARIIGKPKGSRAVGQALRRNPIPIIIPCHRVIKSNGDLGGFGLGIELKKRLLSLEGVQWQK